MNYITSLLTQSRLLTSTKIGSGNYRKNKWMKKYDWTGKKDEIMINSRVKFGAIQIIPDTLGPEGGCPQVCHVIISCF